MRIFAVGTKILGGGAGQHLGGAVPPGPNVEPPLGPGRQVSRSFPCSTSLHIACPKELEAASRSSKTYLVITVEEDLHQFNLGLTSWLRTEQILFAKTELKTEQLGGHSQEQQRHRQAPIDDDDDDQKTDG